MKKTKRYKNYLDIVEDFIDDLIEYHDNISDSEDFQECMIKLTELTIVINSLEEFMVKEYEQEGNRLECFVDFLTEYMDSEMYDENYFELINMIYSYYETNMFKVTNCENEECGKPYVNRVAKWSPSKCKYCGIEFVYAD